MARTRLPRLLPAAALALLCACSSGPPGRKSGTVISRAEARGLVDVTRAVPGVRVDLRYATAANVTGRPLYTRDMPCLLRRSTAVKLAAAQARLQEEGLGLKIWDAWRPPEAHQRLHEHGARTGMFIDPVRGWSRHCGGVSVDATLVDARGRELPMPTHFDENLEHAASDTRHPDPAVRANLALLHKAMRGAGFAPLPGEWWHFDDLEFLHTPIPVIRGGDIGLPLAP
ncbi:MAG TPA: M15 family metallopeptidase [Prosthecobacter sp.]|nr:M15 family metallopeptidase [Prosthecobacter sp.]